MEEEYLHVDGDDDGLAGWQPERPPTSPVLSENCNKEGIIRKSEEVWLVEDKEMVRKEEEGR